MRDKCVEMRDNTNKMRDRLIKILHEMPKEMMIGEAADYLLANGVVVPPVNIGETVYYIFCYSSILELKVASIEIAPIETVGIVFHCYGGVGFYEKDIGKTVFLTREEAERALKGGVDESVVG